MEFIFDRVTSASSSGSDSDEQSATTEMNNVTSGLTPLADEVMKRPHLLVLFISLYCVIFALGTSGNSLVIFVVAHSKPMQTITNIFIANLAVSDILMCLLAVPFTPISGLLQNWLFGDILCHVVPMVMGVSVHVSTLTSTAIAIDRYFVIVHPFVPRMKVYVCLILNAAIWLISISISLPLAIYQEVSHIEEEDVYACHEQWPKDSARQFFTVISLIMQYIVPCTIISLCYGRVSLSLHRRSRLKIGNSSRSRDRMEIQRKRRTNKMLIAMVSIFVCCWLPLNVIQLIIEYNESVMHSTYFLLTFFVAHVIAMSSTVYNPFLYGWMNENFKKEFRQVVPFLYSFTERNSCSTEKTVCLAQDGDQSPAGFNRAFQESRKKLLVVTSRGRPTEEPTCHVCDSDNPDIELQLVGNGHNG